MILIFAAKYCKVIMGNPKTSVLCKTNMYLSVSILTAIFPGGPGLPSTGISQFWILLKLRMMELVVTSALNEFVVNYWTVIC